MTVKKLAALNRKMERALELLFDVWTSVATEQQKQEQLAAIATKARVVTTRAKALPSQEETRDALAARILGLPKTRTYTKSPVRGTRKIVISGTKTTPIEFLNEISSVLQKAGHALSSREIYVLSPIAQKRYRDERRGIAGITSTLRGHGSRINVVPTPHPSGSRKAIAWFFKEKK